MTFCWYSGNSSGGGSGCGGGCGGSGDLGLAVDDGNFDGGGREGRFDGPGMVEIRSLSPLDLILAHTSHLRCDHREPQSPDAAVADKSWESRCK